MLFTTEILKGFLWNKLFRRECLKNERLPYDLDICEDFYFIAKLLCKEIKIMHVTERLYNHLHNFSSATKKVSGLFDAKNELKYLIAMRRIRNLFYDDMQVLKYMSQKEVRIVLETYLLMIKSGYRDKSKEYKFFRLLSENKKYLCTKEEPLKYKFAYALFYCYSGFRSLGVKKENE